MCLLMVKSVRAQDAYGEQVRRYVDKYYPLAVDDQKATGVPAAISLAQAVVETDAGASELMQKANNHFGMKCKPDWKGATILHNDNTPNECFKKYASAKESYSDHSEHLKKNQRYAPLFALPVTDYASWAAGLKNSGYATNPQYAVKLIRVIEDYHLQKYTYMAISGADAKNYPSSDPAAEVKTSVRNDIPGRDSLLHIIDSLKKACVAGAGKPAQAGVGEKAAKAEVPKRKVESAAAEPDPRSEDIKFDSGKLITINGLKGFYAYRGEILLKYAVKHKIRYAKLLELNDLPDAPLEFDMPVYVEKKRANGTHSRHTVTEGECMLLVAQKEAMQLKRLYALNNIDAKEEPLPGAVLELQFQAAKKPPVRAAALMARKPAKPAPPAAAPVHENDYVAVNHPRQDADSSADDADDDKPAAKPEPPKAAKKQPALMREDTAAEDLAGLKSELDREVYADDAGLKHPAKTAPHTAADAPAVAKKPAKPAHEAPKKAKTYKIKKGDTLSSIADKFDVSVKQLRQWNNIKGNAIREGKSIRVQ